MVRLVIQQILQPQNSVWEGTRGRVAETNPARNSTLPLPPVHPTEIFFLNNLASLWGGSSFLPANHSNTCSSGRRWRPHWWGSMGKCMPLCVHSDQLSLASTMNNAFQRLGRSHKVCLQGLICCKKFLLWLIILSDNSEGHYLWAIPTYHWGRSRCFGMSHVAPIHIQSIGHTPFGVNTDAATAWKFSLNHTLMLPVISCYYR